MVIKQDASHHEIIAILERDRSVKVREEDELWIFERPLHGSELGGRSHLGGLPLSDDIVSSDSEEAAYSIPKWRLLSSGQYCRRYLQMT